MSIRKWSAEFREYLSKSAQGGKARHFTEQDARVLAYISQQIALGKAREDIQTQLNQLATEHWVGLPALPRVPADEVIDDNGMLSEAAVLRQRVQELDEELSEERDTHQQTQVELLVAREQLAELRGLLTRLQTVDLDRQQVQADLLAAHTALGQAQAEQEQFRQRVVELQAENDRIQRRLRFVLLGTVIVVTALMVVVVALLVGQGGT